MLATPTTPAFRDVFEQHFTFLAGLWRNTRRYAERLAPRDTDRGRDWTYAELGADVVRVAEPQDRTLNMTPSFHRGGISPGGPNAVFYAGAAAVTARAFEPSAVPELVALQGLTFLIGAPTNLAMLTAAQESEPRDLSTPHGIVRSPAAAGWPAGPGRPAPRCGGSGPPGP